MPKMKISEITDIPTHRITLPSIPNNRTSGNAINIPIAPPPTFLSPK